MVVSLTSFLPAVLAEPWVSQLETLPVQDLSSLSEAEESQGSIFPSSEGSPEAAAVDSYRDPASPRSNLNFGMSIVHRVLGLSILGGSTSPPSIAVRGSDWDMANWRWRGGHGRCRLPPEPSPGSQRSQCSL